MSAQAQPSPHFFHREPDGSVRIRIRFMAEDASLIEMASGEMPLLRYIRNAIMNRAEDDARQTQERLQPDAGEDQDKEQ